MSDDRILATAGTIRGFATPVAAGPSLELLWTDRIAELVSQGVTVYRWGRSEDVSGTVYVMETGANGTIVNPVTGDYAQGALLIDSDGGSSLGLSGANPPTYIEIATVEQAIWEFTGLVLLDTVQASAGRLVWQVNTGAGVAGGAECKIFADGLGGVKGRIERGSSVGRVIKEGSTAAQIPVGEAVLVSFVSRAADLEFYVNGQARSMSLLSGALATWPATPAGTSYVGAFVATTGTSNGLDGLLGEWLVTSPLTAAQRAYLAVHTKQNRVAARDLAGGSVNEGSVSVNFSLEGHIHPAVGNTIAITTPPSVGTATLGPNAIIYTSPASVVSDTPVTISYTNTAHSVTTAPATISVTVTNVVVVPPSGDTLPEDEPLPTATAIANVTNGATFASAYAAASGGNHIVLAPGSYGVLNLNRNFSSTNRLVIRTSTANILGATSTGVTMQSGHIVSGLTINPSGSNAVSVDGSFNRITRSKLTGGASSFNIGAGVTDVLIDHCESSLTQRRMFELADPKNQKRITVARCWPHNLTTGSYTPTKGTPPVQWTSLMFAWQTENIYRERDPEIIVRLCFVGPGIVEGLEESDYVHHKGSGALYAFNHFTGGKEINLRFGMRHRFVGNYAPGAQSNVWDHGHWMYGNVLGNVRMPAGRSALYDTTKSLVTGNYGGFPATTNLRMSGNQWSSVTLGATLQASWCTAAPAGSGGALPDTRPAGDAKPARTHEGVTYAAMSAGDGISIRDHSGTVTLGTGLPCLISEFGAQAINVTPAGQRDDPAPASWLSDLAAEYPWITSICPDPTSRTGGPIAGSTPWSVAQQLTRGDAANPNTGPLRNSPGGRV